MKNASDEYKYPHSYDHHWVDQQYLPDDVASKSWYEAGDIGREQKLAERIEAIKKAYRKSR